jgi:mono/diheme cytochrome c family protein
MFAVSGGRRKVLALVLGALLLAGAGALLVLRKGFSARDEPSGVEKWVARQARHLAVPRAARELKNPLPRTPEVLAEARAHFADHCALCHGNDGRGKTEIGQNLYPKAPDMTLADTQGLSDGELFSIIKNGIRLTGMPAWGQDTPEDDRASWELVHLIRHLPAITEAELREMATQNPVSPAELRERAEEEQFLEGDHEQH